MYTIKFSNAVRAAIVSSIGVRDLNKATALVLEVPFNTRLKTLDVIDGFLGDLARDQHPEYIDAIAVADLDKDGQAKSFRLAAFYHLIEDERIRNDMLRGEAIEISKDIMNTMSGVWDICNGLPAYPDFDSFNKDNVVDIDAVVEYLSANGPEPFKIPYAVELEFSQIRTYSRDSYCAGRSLRNDTPNIYFGHTLDELVEAGLEEDHPVVDGRRFRMGPDGRYYPTYPRHTNYTGQYNRRHDTGYGAYRDERDYRRDDRDADRRGGRRGGYGQPIDIDPICPHHLYGRPHPRYK